MILKQFNIIKKLFKYYMIIIEIEGNRNEIELIEHNLKYSNRG